MKAKRAKEWGLIDGYFPTSKFEDGIARRIDELVEEDKTSATSAGIKLNPLEVEVTEAGREYKYVTLRLNREKRYADLTVRSPES